MTNSEPLVSVIMSVNRDDGNLYDSINSILNQNYKNIEFVIVNDGSSKDVNRVLKKIKDKRIIFLQQKNVGLTACLNFGITKSKGEYIARHDAGDFSDKNRFIEQIKFLQNNPSISMCGSWVNEYSKGGKDLGVIRLPVSDHEIKKHIFFQNTFCHGSIIIKTKVLINLKCYRAEFIRSQDYDLWLRVIEDHNVANLDKVLYSRTISDDSISFSNKNSQSEYAKLARLCFEARQLNKEEPLYLIKKINYDGFKEHSPRKLKGNYNFYCGRRLYSNRRMNLARKYFLSSLISNPIAIKNIIYLILTFLPNSIRLTLDKIWLKSKKKYKINID
ncbi:MAG: hypothetical protein CMG44_03420 [Candidatus Marinimicrobia bacterium]|nr:hypothetical protein [Candidatus Neomarinimicrobiota bacterium]|tara:strand:+ start:15657 stop:16649 length:993 start_codon:yes stop_codon:yes gene_type:complete